MVMLKSPYPWFGGKRAVAPQIWKRLGDVPAFVDPFLGSAATVLGRPNYDPARHQEVVNDIDGLLVNFWRAVQHDPEAVAFHADQPIFESDMHARHAWLVGQKPSLVAKIEGDPDYYDAKVAGWWVWGQSIWLGWGWCSGKGPWRVVDGQLVRLPKEKGAGVERNLPDVDNRKGRTGKGVKRNRPSVAEGAGGVVRRIPTVHHPVGVVRKIPSTGLDRYGPGGVKRKDQPILPYMLQLAERFRHVRVLCGDWRRLLVPAIVEGLNERLPQPQVTGIVFDPPYLAHDREANIYAHDDGGVARHVYEWCLQHGDNPAIRIALCGYDGHYDMPASWRAYRWQANGGYANSGDARGRANKTREIIWFSPHCLSDDLPQQRTLFDECPQSRQS